MMLSRLLSVNRKINCQQVSRERTREQATGANPRTNDHRSERRRNEFDQNEHHFTQGPSHQFVGRRFPDEPRRPVHAFRIYYGGNRH